MILVTSVNVGQARALSVGNRMVQSAIDKRPADGPVPLLRLGLQGDEPADLSVHGGLAKAVYAYPHEHYAFWQVVRAQARVAAWDETLQAGAMGENLTLTGLTEGDMWIGDTWQLPRCTLAVSEPRLPCWKFNHALGFDQAARMMWQSGYCGTYLTVIDGGYVCAGDAITVRPGPRDVNLRELFQARRPAR